MKKLLIVCSLVLLCANQAFGGIVNYVSLSSDAGVSYSHLNDSFTTIYNEVDGSLDTNNLATGAVMSDDIATATSPLVRDFENIGEYVYTGLLPPTSDDLTAITTAGTAYIANDGDSTLHRVVKGATSKTYDDSNDTWVYLDFAGAYYYDVQALGATQPTTPANSIILAKVVTDADNITSVLDKRQTTPPNLRIANDLKNGLTISRDTADTDTAVIGRGEIEFGTAVTAGLRRNTGATKIDFGTSGRGGLAVGSTFSASTLYYLFAVADDDTSTAYEGIASPLSSDAAGVTGERLVGWCWADASTNVSADSIGAYRGRSGDAPNIVSRKWDDDNNTTTAAADTQYTIMNAKIYSSGRPIQISSQSLVSNSNNGGNVYTVISIDSVGYESTVSNSAGDLSTTSGRQTLISQWCGILGEGIHDIEIKWWVDDQTGYWWSGNLIVEEK